MENLSRCAMFLAAIVFAVCAVNSASTGNAAPANPDAAWRFDCGADQTPVMDGYRKLTGDMAYSEVQGFGWETPTAKGIKFGKPVPNPEWHGSWGNNVMFAWTQTQLDALNADGVVSEDELVFRVDVPEGEFRVLLTVGDMSKSIGSMELWINDELAVSPVNVWSAGSYRMFGQTPGPWMRTIRVTAKPQDGAIRIALRKNQSTYDDRLAEQKTWDNPYKNWYHATPVVKEAPYNYIGSPFVHNSIMAIEIVPHVPAPVVGTNGTLAPTRSLNSPQLDSAIAQFNAGEYLQAVETLETVKEPEAQVAKAIVLLYLTGRLETEIERTSVPQAIAILQPFVDENPKEFGVAEILGDALNFRTAHEFHLTRGQLGKHHFNENNKAINYWFLIEEDSPLYDKAQLHIARAGHMLKPYYPTMGTELEIFTRLEKKYPDNRFVKYHLYKEWEPFGDGSDYYDWVMVDYAAKAKDAPEWVRAIYPAYAGLVDLSEWWINYRQEPEGTIGGGWGDDVEMVGLFGYYGYVARGASDLCIEGTNKLCNGVWYLSEVDPERGYCAPRADAEHTAEWTGNTLGLMMQIDYGNPAWIERSMKTGKLIRDLWTDYNDEGMRHFKSNFFGATEIGSGDQLNDSFINYRAVSASTAVLAYNRNPTIGKLYTELADAWVADAMKTDRGKPAGVIPAQVEWPTGKLGGTNSPNWWTASHPEGTVNYDWWNSKTNRGQSYKGYVGDLLKAAYIYSGDTKYFDPFKMEYDLAVKHGYAPEVLKGKKKKKWSLPEGDKGLTAEPGSELWVAARIQNASAWLEIEKMLEGRQGELEMKWTKEEVIERGKFAYGHVRESWPISTSEAGPTDRVGFPGIIDPFMIYTGGYRGGPLLKAAVTYENTTKDFAAAVLGVDMQGMKILFYSMAPDTRVINVVPWELEEAGKYRLVYGIDDNDDETIDTVVETRDFFFKQAGSKIPIEVKPWTNYVIEIEQTERGRSSNEVRPDPGLSADDLSYNKTTQSIEVIVHNVGSKLVKNLDVAVYDGDPNDGGKLIETVKIPEIEAPLDLEPRTETVAVKFPIQSGQREIHVVLDPEGKIQDEITTFNNTTKAKLPKPPKKKIAKKKSGVTMKAGR